MKVTWLLITMKVVWLWIFSPQKLMGRVYMSHVHKTILGECNHTLCIQITQLYTFRLKTPRWSCIMGINQYFKEHKVMISWPLLLWFLILIHLYKSSKFTRCVISNYTDCSFKILPSPWYANEPKITTLIQYTAQRHRPRTPISTEAQSKQTWCETHRALKLTENLSPQETTNY